MEFEFIVKKLFLIHKSVRPSLPQIFSYTHSGIVSDVIAMFCIVMVKKHRKLHPLIFYKIRLPSLNGFTMMPNFIDTPNDKDLF